MQDVVILDAIRTPIGKLRGGLSRVRADDLAAHALGATLDRVEGAREAVEDVAFGDTNQAGEDNRDVARMAVLLAGLPYEVAGVTLNRLCGSGLEALTYCSRAIRLGDHRVMVAGGVESMTRAPYAMEKPDEAFPRKQPKMFDTRLGWRFENPKMAERFELHSLGRTAENVAERYGISREDQDAFALESHRRASAAWERGDFADEVVPVPVPPASKREGWTTFEADECIRADTSLDKLAKLPAVFEKDGTVTAGNSSPLNDGASAMVVSSAEWAENEGIEPLARVVGSAVVGVEPNYMGIGPIPAVRKVLERTGLTVDDIDLFELNEAFAAQSLACVRELGLDTDKVNVNGGAIAIGHPVGCSGNRIATTLAHAMKRRGKKRGLATLCIGVGQGLALVLERP